MYKLLRHILTICFFCNLSLAQEESLSVNSSYDDLYDHIATFHRDDLNAFPYIQVLINKAKLEENYEELFYAYRKAVAYSPEHIELSYTDSVVWAAVKKPRFHHHWKSIFNQGR